MRNRIAPVEWAESSTGTFGDPASPTRNPMEPHIFRHPAHLSDVALTALSGSEWRVTNRQVESSDPSGLIGFIERTGEEFTVIRLGAPLDRSHFPTLEAARAAFVEAPGSSTTRSTCAA
jgi:hypothetical protein